MIERRGIPSNIHQVNGENKRRKFPNSQDLRLWRGRMENAQTHNNVHRQKVGVFNVFCWEKRLLPTIIKIIQ
jgi:hypothetical protein